LEKLWTKKKVCNVDKGSYVLLLSCLSVDATVIHNVFVFNCCLLLQPNMDMVELDFKLFGGNETIVRKSVPCWQL
jgi:hypothetical protein